MKPRPVIYVLAGVNGAGKSSVGGHLLTRAGLAWFNPDAFARELRAAAGGSVEKANGAAWREGMRRLDAALAGGGSYAFETTLGGRIPLSTSGGLLSRGHPPNVTGLYNAYEAFLQLTGRAGARQVRDANLGLCTSELGNYNAAMVHVMEGVR